MINIARLMPLHILLLFVLASCRMAEDRLLYQKNQCYKSKLDRLKEGALYHDVHKSFTDTFSTIQKVRNRKLLLDERVDDAIFFNADSSECLFIVLQRHPNIARSFGTARVYRGQLFQSGWRFQPSMWLTFDGYYEKYSTNSFENISEVARYVVLTDGEVSISGCDIDEYYWFKYLKE